MAADIPTKEPLEFRAGDTVSWTKSLADYSAADYTLTYYLAGPKKTTITATASGTDFSVTLSAADSAKLQAGDYWIEGKVSGADGTFTVYAANIRVLPNFTSDADVSAGFDGRSHARKMLDALESAQSGQGGNRIVSYTIFGQRSVTFMNAAEWQKEHVYWRNIVTAEERQAAIDRGDEGAGKIYLRRREPR